MTWALLGIVGVSLLLTGTVAAHPKVSAWLGMVGGALATAAILGGVFA
jgi:hypothetical protein